MQPRLEGSARRASAPSRLYDDPAARRTKVPRTLRCWTQCGGAGYAIDNLRDHILGPIAGEAFPWVIDVAAVKIAVSMAPGLAAVLGAGWLWRAGRSSLAAVPES